MIFVLRLTVSVNITVRQVPEQGQTPAQGGINETVLYSLPPLPAAS